MKKAAFGQNFLVDTNTARKIVDAAELSPKDYVIEIGPGHGILTRLILEKTERLTAVELDRNLADKLLNKIKNTFPGQRLKHFSLVAEDFLKYKIPKNTSFKYISNLPYYAASPIIRKVVSSVKWKTSVFMVQKEVAARITALPGNRDYGILTLLLRYYSTSEMLFNIGKFSFNPAPQVDSTVIRLTKSPVPKKVPFRRFFKVVTSAFSQRRKTILNSLSSGLKVDKEIVEQALSKSGISAFARAEEVPFEKFLLLTLDTKNIF